MKIGFVVNRFETEKPRYTTTHLASTALARGHEVFYIALGGFQKSPKNALQAHALHFPKALSAVNIVDALRSAEKDISIISIDDLDILMLRNDPAEDVIERPWARLAGVNFGRLAAQRGVIVLNSPDGLNHAVNKIYLQQFPQAIRPLSLISRNKEDIKAFIAEQNGSSILKPITGSGGRNVFHIHRQERDNLNQMIDAVLRDGYALVQEYMPSADQGDIRLFLLNGQTLTHHAKAAAIKRIRPQDDIRSNLTVGGRAEHADVTEPLKLLADIMQKQLNADGLFLVGLDIIDNKVIEINAFSPGGLVGAGELCGVNFCEPTLDALEEKHMFA